MHPVFVDHIRVNKRKKLLKRLLTVGPTSPRPYGPDDSDPFSLGFYFFSRVVSWIGALGKLTRPFPL
jgi:hypothetical protein